MFINIFKNFKSITSLKQRIILLGVVLLSIFSSFFEIFALSTIPLFVAFVTRQEEFFYKFNEILPFIYEIYYNNDLLTLIIIIISIFILKTSFSLLSFYTLEKICYGISSYNAKRLLKIYLEAPYLEIIKIGPSIIQRNILETKQITEWISLNIKFLRESILVLLILVLIFTQNNYYLFLIFLVLFIFSILLYFKVKNIIYRKSKDNQISMGYILRSLSNTFSTIKSITLLNKKNFFLEFFNKKNISMNLNVAHTRFLLLGPKVILELFAVTILLFISYFYLNLNYSGEQTIVLVTMIAVFTIRLAPALSNMANALGAIESRKPAIELLIKEISNPIRDIYDRNIKKDFYGKSINSIELRNINHKYESKNNRVLNNINMKFNSNKIIGLFGESGAGKSTLINILMCLINPTSGQILINEKDGPSNRSSFFPYIGYVPQDIYLFEGTLKSNIALGEDDADIDFKRLKEVIELCELKEFVEKLPDKENFIITADATNISGGQRQRIGLARTLYFRPNMLILDESTNQLDINTEKKLLNKLKELYYDKVFIIISHRLSTLELCDEKIYLGNQTVETLYDLEEIKNKLLQIKKKNEN